MIRFEELFAEIRSELNRYDAAGLIDEIKMVRDATKALKRFGAGITTKQDTVLEVKGGKAKLPDNFHTLYSASLCTPLYYKTSAKVDSLMSSMFYVEKTINTTTWSQCDSCCEQESKSVIKENLYFNNNLVEFHYSAPKLLTLSKHIDKSYVHTKCRNKVRQDRKDEISINELTLYTNFNEGHVYIEFYGLPRDEEGYIAIPETKTGHLETFVEYYLKRRIAESLLANGDAQGLSQMYQVYLAQERTALNHATNEIKGRAFSPRVMRNIAKLNRLESLQYDINPSYQWL